MSFLQVIFIIKGTALVALEALSLGKPTIVLKDGGGLTEIIRDLSARDVVSDVNCLVKRLEYYYKNKSEIIRNNKRRISYSRNFDILNTAKQFNIIYKKLFSSKEL